MPLGQAVAVPIIFGLLSYTAADTKAAKHPVAVPIIFGLLSYHKQGCKSLNQQVAVPIIFGLLSYIATAVKSPETIESQSPSFLDYSPTYRSQGIGGGAFVAVPIIFGLLSYKAFMKSSLTEM